MGKSLRARPKTESTGGKELEVAAAGDDDDDGVAGGGEASLRMMSFHRGASDMGSDPCDRATDTS